MTHVYANGWTDRSGYKTASSEVQANMRKVSHSILQTASCGLYRCVCPGSPRCLFTGTDCNILFIGLFRRG